MPQVQVRYFLIRPHHRLLPPAPCYRSPRTGHHLPIPTAAPTSSEKQGSSICNSSCCHRACWFGQTLVREIAPRVRAQKTDSVPAPRARGGTHRRGLVRARNLGRRTELSPGARINSREQPNLLWLSKSSERFGSYSLRYPLTLANPKGCFGWWGVRVRSR